MKKKSTNTAATKKPQPSSPSSVEENTDDELCPLFGICDSQKE